MVARNKITDGLNDKQLRFCQEYIIDLNGKEAAIRAGYSANCADVTASQFLAQDKFRDKINALQAKRAERVEITQDYVLKKLKDLADQPVGNGLRYADKIRATELLGKHLKLFSDVTEHRGVVGILAIDAEISPAQKLAAATELMRQNGFVIDGGD